MGKSLDDLDNVDGSFDLDGLKKKHRRQEGYFKTPQHVAAIKREISKRMLGIGALRRPPRCAAG